MALSEIRAGQTGNQPGFRFRDIPHGNQEILISTDAAEAMRALYPQIMEQHGSSIAQRSQRLLEEFNKSPDHMYVGILTAATNLEFGSPDVQTTARTVMQRTIADLPRFISSQPKEKQFETALLLLPHVALALRVSPQAMPQETLQALRTSLNRWSSDPERQFIILNHTATIRSSIERLEQSQDRRGRAQRNQDQVWGEFVEDRMYQIAEKLERKTRKAQFDEETLRLAAAMAEPHVSIAIRNTATGGTMNMTTLAYNYLHAFRQNIVGREGNNYLDAARTIADAIANGASFTTKTLASYLVDGGWPTKAENFAFKENTSFLLRYLLQCTEAENPLRRPAQKILLKIIQGTTTVLPDEGIESFLPGLIAASRNFSPVEKNTIATYYLLSLQHFGIFISDPENTDAVQAVLGNTLQLRFQFNNDAPVFILPQKKQIGTFYLHRPHLRPENNTNGNHAAASDSEIPTKTVINENGEGSTEPDKNGIPVLDADSNPPDYVNEEIEANLIAIPDSPEATGFPTHGDIFETIPLLFEQQSDKILRSAGIKPYLPDHVIEAMDLEIAEIGKDLPIERLARTRTFSPHGNTIMFEENPVKCSDTSWPRVHFRHEDPRRIGGILSSDIFGTLSLAPNLQVDFFLDRNGYPQGNLDKLYNEGLISWAQIWQIKYRLTALTHKLLIVSQEELSRKRDTLANRANREIGAGRKGKQHSAEELEARLKASRKYFDDSVFEWSMQSTDKTKEPEEKSQEKRRFSNDLDNIDEIACEKALADMEKTGQTTLTLWRQLDRTGMELAIKDARSKGRRVKKSPMAGVPMFMKSGRKPSIQAIENGLHHGTGFFKVIEITMTPSGLPDIVVSRSTFLSEKDTTEAQVA